MRASIPVRFLGSLLLLAALAGPDCPAAPPGALGGALEALSQQAGFAVEGLDRLGPEPVPLVQGTPAERLKGLLQDYNYLVIEARPGVIEKVRITSRKRHDRNISAASGFIATTRSGNHHQVEAMLVGPNGVPRTVPLLVDTGASTLVLPNSMMAELGFVPEQLQDGMSRTASGRVPVKIGTLARVRVGSVSAEEVQVSFIADRRLSGAMLLGMSFLNRFRMTIDDAKNELILLVR